MVKAHTRLPAVVLLLAGAAIFLPALGQERAVTGREARHAEIARYMLVSREYLVPYVCGRPYIDKPPLFNWSVAALFRLTGRMDFTVARLPSAICAVAAMLGIYLLGRRWLSARAGVYAALIWATSWLVVEWGRLCQMDMMLTCLIFWAVLLADVAASQERRAKTVAVWLAACVTIAAATMSKGPVALLYFFVGVACLWRARRGRWLPDISLLLLAVVLTGAVAGGWLLLAEAGHPGHIRDLLAYQFRQGLTEHPARITLYFDQLLIRTAPWGIFSLGAAYWAVRRVRRCGYDPAAVPALFLLVCLVIMTLTPNKREHYLLPLLPMWSLFIGGFLDRMAALREGDEADSQAEAAPRWQFEWPTRLCLALALAGAAVLAVFWVRSSDKALAAGMLLCATVAILAAHGLVAARRGCHRRALTMLFSICFLTTAAAYPLTLRVLYPPMANQALLRRVAASIPTGAPVGDFNVRSEYLCFKLNRRLTFINDDRGIGAFLGEPGQRYLLLSAESVEKVKGMTGRPLRVVGNCDVGKRVVTLLEIGEGG